MIRQAVRVLKRGGVIAFPTETTYGLGCDPRNVKAVAKVFRIKRRVTSKSLPLVASSVRDVRRIAVLDGLAARLARSHWPGPLTIVLPMKAVGRSKRGGDIAIRVSASAFVRALVRAYGFPLVATSANRSGKPECRSGRAVVRVFQHAKTKPDLVLDAGALPKRKPSTIVRVGKDGRVEVLRKGAVRMKRGSSAV
ncbi:threonylcarbamoyl-AMP synthase [Candidatus Uhrbacteria bacterium RIFCSPHIGHO2_12_FULL_60_25]|uniref:L-threonylcarbamoyladenylate synthase n=1 Tax=Candidatus Uhrbacteria bacterium RIFCSPHIGHO2_12_FULL_60_25 TaxID=1802399 RepID=A0A1F7UMY3_9BACT|nr:MAG: threonylcarbamoyl-AMP synthase [Candidatus Uhrbacteria bacterium RIFCSPHIGHO2_02_FULL_60_44]OGL79622.1 MAG: threonylcarbamoyl-AMP synthase [Candidatus Uhrbacteria bacterium RIFCSPHIGHO2_12_FULL_60_25]